MTPDAEPQPSAPPAPNPAAAGLVLERVLEALGSPLRLAMLRIIARGRPVGVVDIARELRRKPNFTGKQLHWLRDAGIIVPTRSEDCDGRCMNYMLAPALRGQPSPTQELDLGCCLLRWPA